MAGKPGQGKDREPAPLREVARLAAEPRRTGGVVQNIEAAVCLVSMVRLTFL